MLGVTRTSGMHFRRMSHQRNLGPGLPIANVEPPADDTNPLFDGVRVRKKHSRCHRTHSTNDRQKEQDIEDQMPQVEAQRN